MSTETAAKLLGPTIVRAGEGDEVHAFGDTVLFKMGPEQTGGAMTVAIGSAPPGGGPPPHIHHNEDELFLVLEGRYSILANGEWVEIGPGDLAYTPRGNVHTFKNVGETMGRMWLIVTPCGFESFFSQCSVVFKEAAGSPPDMARILGICADHGIEIVH